MTGWLAHRGEEWLRLAQPVLPREQLAEIRSHLQALAQLAPIAAVACHLDYAPRNLLRSPAGVISIIDFEHARYDLAARATSCACPATSGRPGLEEAFCQGYGALSALDRQVIEHCLHLDVLTAAMRASGQAVRARAPR
jgi:Ser/Thr protein kinase RdoA (MazF antagonist)